MARSSPFTRCFPLVLQGHLGAAAHLGSVAAAEDVAAHGGGAAEGDLRVAGDGGRQTLAAAEDVVGDVAGRMVDHRVVGRLLGVGSLVAAAVDVADIPV